MKIAHNQPKHKLIEVEKFLILKFPIEVDFSWLTKSIQASSN